MKRVKSTILIGIVAAVCSCDIAAAQVPTLPPDGGFRLGGPSCATYDRELQPSGGFRPDDEVTVRGSGFPAGSLVLVKFRQLPYEAEMGRFKANEAGEFTSEPRIMRIPAEGVRGPAAIVTSTESGYSATCQLALAAAPVSARRTAKPDKQDEGNEYLSWWLIVWTTLIAVAAGGLAYLRYRRWASDRLARRISGLSGRAPHIEAPPVPPVPPVPLSPPPPVSPWGPDERPTLAAAPPDAFVSPPVLPPGWDDGWEPTPVKFQ